MIRDMTNTPRFATSFPNFSQTYSPDLNVYTFTRDIPLGVTPIGGKSHRNENFSIEIRSDQVHWDQLFVILTSLTNNRGYNSTSLKNIQNTFAIPYLTRELVCKVINDIATNLAWFGRAVFEIVLDSSQSNYKLVRIPSQNMISAFGMYLQLIPKPDRVTWNKSFVLGSKNHVWDVSVPKKLGGLRKHLALIRKLRSLGVVVPSFWKEELDYSNQTTGFDFHRYRLEQDIYKAKITAKWGWNWSDHTLNNWTEVYLFYRILRFKWSQAILREHILNELNLLFDRLKINAKIVIDGLPSSSEINTVRKSMLDGQVSFNDSSNACSV